MSVTDNYKLAMRNFTALTARVAPTLKNKGQEAGIKKLLMVMKSGKTLEQRLADYEAALEAAKSCKDDNLKALPGHLKALATALVKMNEGLKKNMDEFEAQARVLGPSDADLKAGFEILSQRLDALRKYAKNEVVQVTAIVEKRLGKDASAQEVLNKNLKMVYLGIKKGSAEFEAALKQFIAKPTEQNLKEALCSSTAARSISVAVTHWKGAVLKASPQIGERLRADPVHLLKLIDDAAQNKGMGFWEGKFAMKNPGWEDRAKAQAKKYLDQVKNWRIMADEIKGLTQ
ncbi:MAG: hypothetical protein ACT6S0_14655 [Roseateles sp.]|uniref:hypothetical protein n=1 Tax=Roseateles sp. TaxID=1971397 RepID=UPI004036328F